MLATVDVFELHRAICRKSSILNLPTCIWFLCWGWPFDFCRHLQHQKTRVPGLSGGGVCVILRLAVWVEHRLVTDRQTHDYGIYHTSTASSGKNKLLPFCVLIVMFNYINFSNLMLASQMQFSYALMHLLNNDVTENTQVYYSVCLVRYRGIPVIIRQKVQL